MDYINNIRDTVGSFYVNGKAAFTRLMAARSQFALIYRLAATSFPFYAGICVLAGVILLAKDNKDQTNRPADEGTGILLTG